MVNVEKYLDYTNPVELYYSFKVDFYKLIDKNLAEWTNGNLLKQYYQDYEFDNIRILLDDRVETWKRMCLNSIEEGVSDKVYNTAYRNWKEVDDAFMVFYETYNDLVEFNVM